MKDKSTHKKHPEAEGAAPSAAVPGADDAGPEAAAPELGDGRDPVTVKMKALEQEAAESHDRLLRLSAEFENYKKRMNRQMDDFRKYANESLLKDLLTVVDNLERAAATPVGTAPGEGAASTGESVAECVREGVELTLGEIVKILTRHHVTAIDAMEKPFDPAYHEAVMQEPCDDHPENTVINVFQKGYLIHDRLLRPAMVVVSKKNA